MRIEWDDVLTVAASLLAAFVFLFWVWWFISHFMG